MSLPRADHRHYFSVDFPHHVLPQNRVALDFADAETRYACATCLCDVPVLHPQELGRRMFDLPQSNNSHLSNNPSAEIFRLADRLIDLLVDWRIKIFRRFLALFAAYAINYDRERNKTPTNILKLCTALKVESSDGIQQVIMYDPGVGTGRDVEDNDWLGRLSNRVDRYIGGFFGKISIRVYCASRVM